MVQGEALHPVLEQVSFGQAVIAHPPVRRKLGLKRIQGHLVRFLSCVSCYECGNGHRGVRRAPSRIVARWLTVGQVVIRRVEPFTHVEPGQFELPPRFAVERLIVLHKGRSPRHNGRCEIAAVLRGFELPVAQRIIKPEEALLVAAFCSARIQIDFQIVNRLKLSAQIEAGRIVLLIGLVLVGVCGQPTSVGRIQGEISSPVAL